MPAMMECAARMESARRAGTHPRQRGIPCHGRRAFLFEGRGTTNIKSIGLAETFFLTRRLRNAAISLTDVIA
jgi:hypothetical protein